MTILEKIKFEEDWLSEVNLTKENIKIAFAGIRATVLEQPPCEDCISRQAVLEKAVIVPIAKVVTEDKVICRKIVFVEDIQKLPSVTPTYDLEEYSTKLWKLAHERGKAEGEQRNG